MITGTKFGLSVVVLSTAMGMTALAQSATQATPAGQDTTSSASASGKQMSVDDSSTYATGMQGEDFRQKVKRASFA